MRRTARDERQARVWTRARGVLLLGVWWAVRYELFCLFGSSVYALDMFLHVPIYSIVDVVYVDVTWSVGRLCTDLTDLCGPVGCGLSLNALASRERERKGGYGVVTHELARYPPSPKTAYPPGGHFGPPLR